jgi:hypothetical protein
MAAFSRRAFVSMGLACAFVGINPSPANAQTISTAQRALIRVSTWAWPHLKNALLNQLSDLAVRYAIEHAKDFVDVIVHLTEQAREKIQAVLRDETAGHLLEISMAAISAGIVLTVAVTGPGSLVALPAEIFAEAVGLPFLLTFYHEDVLNFVTGQAYTVSFVSSY